MFVTNSWWLYIVFRCLYLSFETRHCVVDPGTHLQNNKNMDISFFFLKKTIYVHHLSDKNQNDQIKLLIIFYVIHCIRFRRFLKRQNRNIHVLYCSSPNTPRLTALRYKGRSNNFKLIHEYIYPKWLLNEYIL